MKFSSIPTVLLIVLILISGTSISITLNKKSTNKNYDFIAQVEKISNGPAPIKKLKQVQPNLKSINFDEIKPTDDCFTMYGYSVCPGPESIIYFDVCDPGTICYLNDTESDDFLSGATGLWYMWYACENSTGAIWKIDPYSGVMTYIGGGGVGLNGLAYNPVINVLFGASGSDLYKIDIYNGDQEYIGSFGNNINEMIGISSDVDGILYGWDLGYDKLWIIDTETGEATEVGPLGIDLNYAQDGDFLRETDTLYLTAYTISPNNGSYLYTCDKESGQCTIIGQFEDNTQVTASICDFGCPPYFDIGVKGINSPDNGYAADNIPMQVIVKNYGCSTYKTDVKMQVNKYIAGSELLYENFTGTFPPAGWTTDWWEKSNSDYSCGEVPEAMCFKDTQSSQGDYYDNYIMTPCLDCSEIEKVELSFKFNIDVNYYNLCNFYVKFRKDSDSAWKDITPWENPIPAEYGCEEFLIGILGDPYLGSSFQIKWEYIGYYYYFNYWWLDNVKISEFGYIEEYNEVIEDVEIPYQSEVIVDFPDWTPTNWLDPDYENIWLEYNVNVCTLLNDMNPDNNCLDKQIDLYFPYLHDVGLNNIESPYSSYAKTFPVTCDVKNFGQYNESNFEAYIEIAEIDTESKKELLIQNFSDITFPPSGWKKTHYNWMYNSSNYSGGEVGEARFFHSPTSTDVFRLFTPAIDTSDCDHIEIKFNHLIENYSNPFILRVETSSDAVNWDVVWNMCPIYDEELQTITIFTDVNVGSLTYVSWTYVGYSGNIKDWYIDDIFVNGYDILHAEYEDIAYITKIDTGEELEIQFNDWTPDFLQYEITGIKKYIAKAWTELDNPTDNNSDNDILTKSIELSFIHDVNIHSISSPRYFATWPPSEICYHYDDGTTIDSFGLTQGGTFEYAIRLTPDEIGILSEFGGNITRVKRHHSCNNSFEMPGKIKIYRGGTTNSPGELIIEEPFECFDADWHEIELSEPVEIIGDEDIWVSCEVTHEAGQFPAGMDPLGPVYRKSDWLYLNSEWVEAYKYGIYTDWNLRIGIRWCGPPQPYACIKPGIEDINVTVMNIGTFPEYNLTCYAKFYELITDPGNLSLVYEDFISDIDLKEPLGGKKYLEFEDYDFSMEGIYVLSLKMPDINDDKPINNERSVSIHVDNTSPISDYPPIIDPPEPDGLNGWYVSNVTVTLNATDPISNGVLSGVREIRYTINGGPEQVIPGKTGSLLITDDGEDILVEYWAVDCVGNIEKNKYYFEIDIDKTPPNIQLCYEVTGGNKWLGWEFTFSATATDDVSSMDRVEFYLNSILQETIEGPGPLYEWSIRYSPIPNAIFIARGYNKAGLFDFDEIVDPRCTDSQIHSKFQQIYNNRYKIIKIPHMK